MTDATHQPGRNDPCHCGSGRKYKQCCLAKDEAEARAARAKALEEAPAPPAEGAEGAAATSVPAAEAPAPSKRQKSYQPWKKSATNTHGFQRMSVPRKVGGG